MVFGVTDTSAAARIGYIAVMVIADAFASDLFRACDADALIILYFAVFAITELAIICLAIIVSALITHADSIPDDFIGLTSRGGGDRIAVKALNSWFITILTDAFLILYHHGSRYTTVTFLSGFAVISP